MLLDLMVFALDFTSHIRISLRLIYMLQLWIISNDLFYLRDSKFQIFGLSSLLYQQEGDTKLLVM